MSKAKKIRTRRANVTIDETTVLPGILQKLQKLTAQEVHIGVDGGEEIAMVAGILEHGSIKAQIPARSFIGTGRKKAAAAVSKLVREGLQAIVEGNKQPEGLLEDLGSTAKDKVLRNFDRIRAPALSPIYAKRKGSSKILVDEQNLRESITYVVVRKRGRSR